MLLVDFTHYAVVSLLKCKLKVRINFKNFILQFEAKWKMKAHKIRCDNTDENTSADTKISTSKKRILLDYSRSHVPQLVGKSVDGKGKSFISDSNLLDEIIKLHVKCGTAILPTLKICKYSDPTVTNCGIKTEEESWYPEMYIH